MISVSANDLKRKGISVLGKESEALLTVRGEPCYVILKLDHYEALREAELEIAILQTKREIAEGKFIKESAKAHVKRISK